MAIWRRFLHREGFALHNLASLPQITVAGAIATATHGWRIRRQVNCPHCQ